MAGADTPGHPFPHAILEGASPTALGAHGAGMPFPHGILDGASDTGVVAPTFVPKPMIPVGNVLSH